MLITEEYRREQEILHARGNYGTASLGYGPVVSALANALQIGTLLDYGCGSQRNLLKVFEPDHDVEYEGYDPGVPAYCEPPSPADLVVCIDVLEHIEPEFLENVLDHLRELSRGWSFMTVHTGPARKTLSDGRNAHLIQQPPAWWLPKFCARWELLEFRAGREGFSVVCRSQPLPN
jgi:hypothetical protein